MCGSSDTSLKIISPEGISKDYFVHRGKVHSISIGNILLVTASDDLTIKIWNRVSLNCLDSISVGAQNIQEALVTFDDSFITARVNLGDI